MILYLEAETNIPDVYIDYIEVQLTSGETVSLNWDESDISRSDNGFDARYKGVYFGDLYANGRIDELKDFKITDIGLYYETTGSFHFQINEMLFEDDHQTLTITQPDLPYECDSLQGLDPKAMPKLPLSDRITSSANRAESNYSAAPLSRNAPDLAR